MITDEQLAGWRRLCDKGDGLSPATGTLLLDEIGHLLDEVVRLRSIPGDAWFRCNGCDTDRVGVDEDGCCTTCGDDAEPVFEVERLRAEVTQLRVEAVDLSADLHAREERAMAAEAEVERLRDAATALRAILSVSTGADGAMRGVWLRGDADHVAVVEALDAALAGKESSR